MSYRAESLLFGCWLAQGEAETVHEAIGFISCWQTPWQVLEAETGRVVVPPDGLHLLTDFNRYAKHEEELL